MAKKNKNQETSNPSAAPTPSPGYERPEGYTNQGDDIVGVWDYTDGHPIHFCPLHVKLSDSKLDARKTSALIFGRLVEACQVHTRDADGESIPVMAEPGDMVGVWYKAGMRRIANLGKAKVWMRATGTKDVGKPSPMVVFEILADRKGSRLRVEEDYREESTDETVFDSDDSPQPAARQTSTADGDGVPLDANGRPLF